MVSTGFCQVVKVGNELSCKSFWGVMGEKHAKTRRQKSNSVGDEKYRFSYADPGNMQNRMSGR